MRPHALDFARATDTARAREARGSGWDLSTAPVRLAPAPDGLGVGAGSERPTRIDERGAA